MNFDLVFTDGAEGDGDRLETEEWSYVRAKLEEIASSTYRHPTDWNFARMEGCADGRFGVGDGLRVFADIDENRGVITIRKVGRRENLYT